MSTATEPRPAERATAPTPAPVASSVFTVLLGERLRERRLVPLVWGGSLGVMGAMMVLVWPSIEGTVSKLISSYPESMLKAFGISGFNTIEQYLDGELFGLLVPLASVVLVVRLVIRPIAGAEDAGQLDTWLTMPIPRRALAWSSFVAAIALLAATLAGMWLITMAVSVISGGGLSGEILARGLLNVLPLATFFAGLAMVATGAMRGSSRVTGVALGALFAMYLVDLVGKLAPEFDRLRYASAFRYYGSAIVNGLDAGHIGGLLAAGLLLAFVGAELFQRRDV